MAMCSLNAGASMKTSLLSMVFVECVLKTYKAAKRIRLINRYLTLQTGVVQQMNKEPEIIINGTKVTDGMAMTIRVAIESYAMDLRSEGLGDDEHGKAMTKGYLDNIDYIRRLIFTENLR